MFGDDLEQVILGSVHHIGQRAVDDLANLLAVLRGFSLSKIDSNEWHAVSFN
jgi:hypothetical protein